MTPLAKSLSPSPDADRARVPRGRDRLLGAALFVLVGATFVPAIRHEFIAYDDVAFVTANKWVQQGLTWANVRHAFTTFETANWHPLTWLSHLFDVQLYGLHPSGHHLTNILLHAINAVLIFMVWRRMTGAVGLSWIVAALFGLHPMHVESVAWVAKRKDVLSSTFWLLALWAYLGYVRRRDGGRPAIGLYLLMTVLFAAGLMCKPMLVTLPFTLLLLDVWPLRRWQIERSVSGSADAVRPRRGFTFLVAEKVPLFALSALDSWVTLQAQTAIGAVQDFTRLPFAMRLLNATISYARYVKQAFFPTDLAVYYPYHPIHGVAVVAVVIVGLVGATAMAVSSLRRNGYVAMGWFWFLGTLVPVIGLVQVGGQAMADRYSYVPYLGLFTAVVWSAGAVVTRLNVPRRTAVTLTALLLAASAVATDRQLSYWRNSETLFQHALAVTQDNVPALLGLGYFENQRGHTDAALARYRAALGITPNLTEARRSVAALLAKSHQSEAAIAEWQIALRERPGDAQGWLALGQLCEETPGRTGDAVVAYEKCIEIEPANAEAQNRLGNLLATDPARREEALRHFHAALAADPTSAEIHLNIGATLADAGRYEEAVVEYQALLRVKPDFADAHNNLANVYIRLPGHAADAETEYRAALRLAPANVAARFNYAQLLGRVLGRRDDALAEIEQLLRQRPDFEPARQYALELEGRGPGGPALK